MLKCKICGKSFDHLGSHIAGKHKMTAKEYKMQFDLPINQSLVTEKVREKQRKAWYANEEQQLKNLFASDTMFKKGHMQAKGCYKSSRTKKAEIEQIKKYNKNRGQEKCPVCKMVCDHLPSHLFNKHQLLMVNNKK